MKYFKLVWKNVLRNKRRTILSVLSIAFSFFLVTFLTTLSNQLMRVVDTPGSVRRIAMRRSTSLQEHLPESYYRKIQAVPEVEQVLGLNWFGGIYREPKNFFANFAVDHSNFFETFPEIKLDDAARQGFMTQRNTAFAGRKLAERFNWKVGDKITLIGTIYPVDLEFNLVGIYTSDVDERNFYFRRDYFEESQGKPGKVGMYFILLRSKESVPTVIDQLDSMFRNTEAETLTETERAFQGEFLSMLGNVQGLVMSIGSVVVFMILLVVGNTMSMTIRERSHEIAILKSFGYQNGSLVGMLVSESITICLMGGMLGITAATLLFRSLDMNQVTFGFIREFTVSGPTAMWAFAIALGVGIISGAIPAVNVVRLSVSDGLRRIG